MLTLAALILVPALASLILRTMARDSQRMSKLRKQISSMRR